MVLGLELILILSPRDSESRVARYLNSLITHLDWPGFLENFLASDNLQQFQVKPSMNNRDLKWQGLWQATAEYLQKQNLSCSLYVSMEPTTEQNLITERKLISLSQKIDSKFA